MTDSNTRESLQRRKYKIGAGVAWLWLLSACIIVKPGLFVIGFVPGRKEGPWSGGEILWVVVGAAYVAISAMLFFKTNRLLDEAIGYAPDDDRL